MKPLGQMAINFFCFYFNVYLLTPTLASSFWKIITNIHNYLLIQVSFLSSFVYQYSLFHGYTLV